MQNILGQLKGETGIANYKLDDEVKNQIEPNVSFVIIRNHQEGRKKILSK